MKQVLYFIMTTFMSEAAVGMEVYSNNSISIQNFNFISSKLFLLIDAPSLVDDKIIKAENNSILNNHHFLSVEHVDKFTKKDINFIQLSGDTISKKDSVLIISPKVGDFIDSSEKVRYHLFPFWENSKFRSAQFIKKEDGKLYVVGAMRDGTTKVMPYSKSSYERLAETTFREKPTDTILSDEQKIVNRKEELKKLKKNYKLFCLIIGIPIGIIKFIDLTN